MFAELDVDGSGKLSAAELADGLSGMDIGLTRSQIVNLIYAIDSDGDGAISKEEFESAFTPKYLGRTTTAEDLAAAEKEGSDEQIAQAALARIGRLVLESGTPIGELFEVLDADHSGALSHAEFSTLLSKVSWNPL